ncbi:M48 family metallopeptidase [Desulfospira joergensenii]|uniref:M48 family metallopeptidase n=1 Tax=Desulfospira joergensenii TaxID=53329 RepID=UPI0003B63B1F|nr:M48 family metallopeptidase [Desulfospira joergensenii]
MRPQRFFLTLFAFLFILAPAAASAISIPDEMKLAEKFMKMIEERNVILKDPVANHMINEVGGNIISTLPPQPFHYSFYILNDNRFNAFASPAANIFFNRGLITALSSTDELAGIMGHEIAHAVSRHVSQSVDRSKLVSIGTMAGVLAGALVGATGGGGEAVQALSIGSMAAGQSAMLAYTRENETEADQKALLFLKKTCYSPKGLLSSLIKIRESDYQGIEGIPDYFKTHPGTGKRIAHVSSLLADYKPSPTHKACTPDYDFDMVKYRLIGLYEDLDKSIARIGLKLEKNPENPAMNYGMGLLYLRKHRREKAVEYLEKALSQRLFDPMILLELGRVHIIDGKFSLAMDVLTDVQEDPVIGLQAKYYYSVAQLESGNLAGAEKNLERVIAELPETFPRAYYYMAKIMAAKKLDGLSHYYLGIFYSEEKDGRNASRHLKKALETLEDPKLKKEAEKRLEKTSESRKR